MNSFIGIIGNGQALLTPEESWHCARVLRGRPGDRIRVIDGKGNAWEATLNLVSDKQCTAQLTSEVQVQRKRNYRLHLAIAPTKQIDRIEWMTEKAVEIGIDAISFIQTKNSERTAVKTDRIQKIVESAVKQSLQAFIPEIQGLVPFKNILNTNAEQKFIAHCFEGEKTDLRSVKFNGGNVVVLIGPEGDFTQEEVKAAETAGFKGLDLGPNRLRTETAGLYVCQAAALLS